MLRLRSGRGGKMYVHYNGQVLEIVVNSVNATSIELGFSGPREFRVFTERNHQLEMGKEKTTIQQNEEDDGVGHLWKGDRDNSERL